jgi:hypothetical protein
MPRPPDRDPVTDGLVDMLVAGTGRPCALNQAPSGATTPYSIVYSIPGGGFDGSLANPDGRCDFVYQVTSVGADENDAQQHADLVRRKLLERSANGAFTAVIAAGAFAVILRRPDGGPGGMTTEGAGDYLVVSIPERFVLTVE